jgi:hypothetical protein
MGRDHGSPSTVQAPRVRWECPTHKQELKRHVCAGMCPTPRQEAQAPRVRWGVLSASLA